jgi:hypothetical protein
MIFGSAVDISLIITAWEVRAIMKMPTDEERGLQHVKNTFPKIEKVGNVYLLHGPGKKFDYIDEKGICAIGHMLNGGGVPFRIESFIKQASRSGPQSPRGGKTSPKRY